MRTYDVVSNGERHIVRSIAEFAEQLRLDAEVA